VTLEASTFTVTPDGMPTGCFPIRDIFKPSVSLPDFAHDLAADAALAALDVGENPL
jgi:hypothetical protein